MMEYKCRRVLIYVKSGELTVGKAAEACRLHDGSICLFRPYEPQIYSVNGVKTSYYWIHFSGREAEAMLSFFKKRSYHIGMLPEFEYYCHGPLEELNAAPEFAERLCEGRLIALIAKIAQKIHTDTATEKSMAMIRPALAAIHSDGGSQLTNEELSRLCNLSKSSVYVYLRNESCCLAYSVAILGYEISQRTKQLKFKINKLLFSSEDSILHLLELLSNISFAICKSLLTYVMVGN